MAERWRKPIIPVGIDHSSHAYSSDGHGWRKHLDWVLTPEDFERVREGYVCINCMEPHEIPYPEACVVCGFKMRDEQAKMIAFEYEGEKYIGPSTSMREEMEKMADEAEQRKPRKTSILLPGKDF